MHTGAPPPFAARGNWLIPSAAAKVDLTRRMREALNAIGLRLHAADSSPLSAAFHFSDGHFLLPSIEEAHFMRCLKTACAERNIRVILPTRDADLLFFAKHRDELIASAIWPLVSDTHTLELCLDKIRFHAHCLANGLPVLPRLENPTDPDYPCFVRPRIGAAGEGSHSISNAQAMQAFHGPPPWPDLLIQPLCADPEYTVDALFDLEGHAVQWIARERLRIKAGESIAGRTVSIPALDAWMPALAQTLHLVGPVTLQAFHSEPNGARLIEVNPRFGGAAALGIEAGLDTPRRLVALAQGNMNSFRRPRPLRMGLTLLRYSQDVFVDENTDPPSPSE